MQPDFLDVVRKMIEYQKTVEIDLVDGEKVIATSSFKTRATYGYGIVYQGEIGVIEAEWHDELHGIPAQCFLLSVAFPSGEKVGINADYSKFIKSVDPRWAQAPKRPYSLGGSNYGKV